MGNKGAYIVLNGKEMKPNFEVYDAVSHPPGEIKNSNLTVFNNEILFLS
jgi:hypothetical protein